MSHREFQDSHGRRWAVWSVIPEHAERRASAASDAPVPVERRKNAEYRVPFSGDFAHGWLCFERKGEKRRLSPFPSNWSNMTDSELGELCASAEKVAHGTRRLVE